MDPFKLLDKPASPGDQQILLEWQLPLLTAEIKYG
jgi:hypothetical protein